MFAEFGRTHRARIGKDGKYGKMLLSFGLLVRWGGIDGGGFNFIGTTHWNNLHSMLLYTSQISVLTEMVNAARNTRLVRGGRGGTELFALSYRRVMACCE